MKYKVLSWVVVGCIFLGVLGLVMCTAPGIGANTGNKGSITVQLGSSQAKSLVPTISLTCTSYSVSGTCADGSTFGPTTVSGTTTFNALNQGAWTINVTGMNASATPIASGSATTTVVAGSTVSVSVTVAEYSGGGTLALTMDWTAAIASPSITASLQDASDNITAQSWNIQGQGATSSMSLPHAGWYADVCQVLSSGNLVCGFAEAVRIAQGQTTSGTITLTPVVSTGSISVLLSPAMNDPLSLTCTPTPGSLAIASPTTFSVTAGGTSIVSFWYVNGVYQATGNTYTLPLTAVPVLGQNYRLDLVSFSANGQNGGDASWTIVYEDAGTITVEATPTNNAAAVTITVTNAGGTVMATGSGSWPLNTLSTWTTPTLPSGSYTVELKDNWGYDSSQSVSIPTLQPVVFTGL
jgi:hypothetical protein